MTKPIHLSKSRILSGLQCEKRLWLEVHRPELKEDSAGTTFTFALGNMVGEVAQQLVPEGKLIGWENGLSEAIKETKRMIDNNPETPLFEATFSYKGVLIRADILFKEDAGHRMVEVKGSTSVKDYYLDDCAVQYWVSTGSGCQINKVELAHIDKTFVYPGDGNYQGLLKHVDITNEVIARQEDVPRWVSSFQKMLSSPTPEIEIGEQCVTPYECPFCNFCWPEEPEYPLTALPRISQNLLKELRDKGFQDIRDIPPGYLSNDNHERVRRITVSGKPEINPILGQKLQDLPYPRYYLDFETLGAAVPIWKGTSPYQAHLPFQWSCHVENAPGNIVHEGYLDIYETEPMRPLGEKLLEVLGKSGPIITYSAFEKSVITKLADFFPDLADGLFKLKERIVDILPMVRDHYYHPDMHGSWSIKAVLPTLAPELNYGDLEEVHDGTAAQAAYMEAISPGTEIPRKKALESHLWEYCKLDTLAMVKIVHNLSR
ncbi:conserved hypothetical protein [Desulfatibacillum aliphaticivorans]|uniref:DUF2779 domain-containing protein n=1 Tax=Desulfatibacillum aliphaticivorans TaxID=218208 RepID=B8FD46_DESAL|nr:DUF2779 domain-containing protein [Desulfatibacillum aliphaticivorans]ACL06477.1 conserved hypothetical protein [Desulfatibacillum aliphaticivorans]